MKSLFIPATALMNRMRYTSKFMLLALTSLVAFGVVGCGLMISLNEHVRTLRLELQGLALIEPIPRSVQLVQQHRGLSVGRFGGVKTLQDGCAAKKKEIVESLDEAERLLPASLVSGEDWTGIREGWRRIQEDGFIWSAEENFSAHSRLIGQLLSFQVSLADQYALTLSPQFGTSYTIDTAINKLPAVIERLGRIRAYGTGILAARQATDADREYLFGTVGQLDDALLQLESNLEKIGRHSPAIRSSLSAMQEEIFGSARLIAGIVTSDILAGRFDTPPEKFFMLATLEIDRAYAEIHESLLPMAGALIGARLARAEHILYVSLGVTLLLLLAVAYFAVGIYHSIIDNVRSVKNSARAFADGDTRERVHLGTRDELGQIGDSFNEMADGFNAIRNQLRESCDELHGLLNSMAEGAYGTDNDGNCTFVNQSFLKMLGYRNESEVLGRNMHDLIHHSRADGSTYVASECRIYRACRANQEAHVDDEVFWRKDGVAVQVEYWSLPVVADGVTTGSIVTFVDITERNRAKMMLHESEEKLRAILASMLDGILIVDTESMRFTAGNPAICRMLGYSQEEIGQLALADIHAPEDLPHVIEQFERQLHGEPGLATDIPVRRKDGSVFYADINSARAEFGGRNYLVGTFRDTTRRKQSEFDLREYQQLLRELTAQDVALQEAKYKHIAREVHDELGQLLTALRMEASLLRIQFGKCDPALMEKVREMLVLVDKAIQGVRNVAANLRPAALDMGIVPAIGWLCDNFPGRANTACTLRVVENPPKLDDARTVAIFRIVQESLTNVARHAEAGSVEITIEQHGGDVAVEVRDDGKGFDPAAKSAKESFGLMGMRERAMAVGGKVEVASAPARGTVISVRIPVSAVEDAS